MSRENDFRSDIPSGAIRATSVDPGHRGPGGRADSHCGLPILFLLLIFFSLIASAQDGERHGFRRFTVEQGLSQGTANAILQDHDGFIWIGTLDGLNRFDGVEFRIYRHDSGDSLSISDNWITSIHEDERQRLWIGTWRGLSEFDRRTETFRRYATYGPDGTRLPDKPVSMIQSTRGPGETRVFVAGGGYFSVDTAARRLVPLQRSVQYPDGAATAGVTGMWAWNNTTIYAISPLSLRMDPLLDVATHAINTVVPVGPDSPGKILVGTVEGLKICNLADGGSAGISGIPPVRSILPDGKGGFWLATDIGLWSLKRNDSSVTSPDTNVSWVPTLVGLEAMTVLSVSLDSTGTVWAGSHGGLYRRMSSSLAFTVYRHRDDNPNSLVSDFVMPIMEDRSGRIWFGTIGLGVSVMTPGKGGGGPTFRNFFAGNGLKGSPVGGNIRSILQSRDGTTWLGTNAGLIAYDSAMTFAGRYPSRGRGDSRGLWVDALFESRDGTLWAGANPLALVRVDPSAGGPPSFTTFLLLDREAEPTAGGVNVIVESADGTLWVGTESGLFRFNPRNGDVKHYVHGEEGAGLSNNFIWSLSIEARGGREFIWIGTSQGLNRFDPASGEWKAWYRQEGFPNDWVYGIIPDDLGRLWLTTNRGITCFDDNRPAGSKFRNFNATDGIAGDECNRRSYARLRSGEIIFGGTMGVTRFDPLLMTDNRHVPPVVLTSVLNAGRKMYFDTDITELKQLRLGHEENDLSFEFSALDYTNPVKNQYAFMMQGHDREWTFIGNRRFVSYAGLDPGQYVFRVKASNNDGVWNEAGISLALVIEPPFWESWWFIGSAVAGVFLAVVGVFRAREKRIEEIFTIRRKIARDLHDEIGSNLTGIAVSGSLLKDTGALTPEQEERVTEITSIAVRTSEMMRDLIWVIRPENDRLDELCFRMKDAAGGILGGTNCHFTMPPDPSSHTLNQEMKHNFYLIYKEIITNIARHAKAKEVTVGLEVSGRSLVLTVSDDGVGFDTSRETKGMGLKNLSARTAALGGTIVMKSAPGVGTSVRVSFPFT